MTPSPFFLNSLGIIDTDFHLKIEVMLILNLTLALMWNPKSATTCKAHCKLPLSDNNRRQDVGTAGAQLQHTTMHMQEAQGLKTKFSSFCAPTSRYHQKIRAFAFCTLMFVSSKSVLRI